MHWHSMNYVCERFLFFCLLLLWSWLTALTMLTARRDVSGRIQTNGCMQMASFREVQCYRLCNARHMLPQHMQLHIDCGCSSQIQRNRLHPIHFYPNFWHSMHSKLSLEHPSTQGTVNLNGASVHASNTGVHGVLPCNSNRIYSTSYISVCSYKFPQVKCRFILFSYLLFSDYKLTAGGRGTALFAFSRR